MTVRGVVFQDVLETVGMQVYYHLHPEDLFRLGLCGRHFWDEISRGSTRILAQHLPLRLGVGTNYLVEFREGRSFSCKGDVAEHVLDKAEAAGLLMFGTASAEESRRLGTRSLAVGPARTNTSKFYSRSESILNPNNRQTTTVECSYISSTGSAVAASWASYILNRDACKRTTEDRETYRFVKAWLDFLSSQRSTTLRKWSWSCKHQALNGRGIAGAGVIIRRATSEEATSSEEENIAAVHTLEVRLTRIY